MFTKMLTNSETFPALRNFLSHSASFCKPRKHQNSPGLSHHGQEQQGVGIGKNTEAV